METIVWIIHLLVAAALIGLVLLQHGKGADMGAAFGSGASGSLFGASGSANFLSRATAVLATVFFFTSMGLTYFSLQNTKPTDVMQRHAAPPASTGPASTPVPTHAPTGNAGGPGSKAGEIPK
jgi:preprotein translocase subunit SecG